MNFKKIIFTVTLLGAVLNAFNLSSVILKDGVKIHGKSYDWDSSQLKGKAHTILYMDPDKRKEVMSFLNALNSKNYKSSKYSTVAIVNLEATWLPNSILISKLNSKEKELKNTEFVFDRDKTLVKKWSLKDDDSNVIIVNKRGKVLFKKSGNLSKSDMNKIFNILSKYEN
jgi:predicted transcriptional regulator